MVTIPDEPTPVTSDSYPRSRTLPGAIARLLREPWHEMTRRANESPNHVSNPERWLRLAKEQNPTLTEDQARRAAALLEEEFLRRRARAGVEARNKGRKAARARKARGE